MIQFRIAPHSIRRDGASVVELLEDGDFVGAIYPGPDGTIRIASKHFAVNGRKLERIVDDFDGVMLTIHLTDRL